MKFDILTLFPEMFAASFNCSIMKRAREQGCVEINFVNIRDFATDRHRTVDGPPCGGGPGMIMKPEILAAAINSVKTPESRVLLMSPQGGQFQQAKARKLARESHLVIVCGHYEGFDERIRQSLADDEISIGDYILTNGNLAAMVVVDAITRLLPNVLGDRESATSDSFGVERRLDFPQYTKPVHYEGMVVPQILLSGDHKKIADWRRGQADLRTAARRPDLIISKGIDGEKDE